MKKKIYKIKVTKKLIKTLKPYWGQFKILNDMFYQQIGILEEKMAKEIGIKGIEIYFCDGEGVGIGNIDRTMRLIHQEELEK